MGDSVNRDSQSRESTTATPSAPDTPVSLASPLPKRRNGKLQSCEPCRKAKVFCDHGHPKCQRCLKKGIVDQCIYHPAPLTRQNGGTDEARVTKRRPSQFPKTCTSVGASNLLLMLSQQRSLDTESHATEPPEGYLGPTNYTAVFRETQPQIAQDLWREENEENQRTLAGLSSGTPKCLDSAIEVLKQFPDEATGDRLFKMFFFACDMGLHEHTLGFALRKFWSTWGTHMRARNYRPVAERLLKTPPISARTCRDSAEWVRSFTNDNFRFEMIGVFLAMYSISAMALPVWDPLFDVTKNGRLGKKLYAEKLGEAADVCVGFCNDQAAATEPMIWLLYLIQISQSQYRGDDDGFLWHKAGQVATAITSFGLHRKTFIDSSPFMVAQLRRRTFATAYVGDKQLSTYTGRPPRLSKRFCNCSMPYDLSDEELMAEGEQLETILASLDKDGWNTDGRFRGAATGRLLMLSSMVRDEILELCLGPSADVSESRKEELLKRAEESYYNVPERFLLPSSDDAIMALPTDLFCVQLMYRMDHIFNRFLIERVPSTDRSCRSTDALIAVAIQVLEYMAFMQKYRDRLDHFFCVQSWLIVYYAIPAASVLSVELLKQHQYPHRYHNKLPRSEAIRLLSTYLLSLSGVGPEEGNYKICQRMYKVLTRILDEVLELSLDSSATPTTQVTPGSSTQLFPEIDLAAVMDPNDDPEFTDWLQSVDWSKAPWTEPMGGF